MHKFRLQVVSIDSMDAYISLLEKDCSEAVIASLSLTGHQAIELQSRQKIVTTLVSDLARDEVYSPWSQEALLQVLQSLKLLSRDYEAAKSLYTTEGIGMLMRHADLLSESYRDSAVIHESLKCLANCLLLESRTREIFHSLEGEKLLVSKFQSPSLSNDSQFLFGRILFLSTVSSPKVVNILANNGDFLSAIDEIIGQCINSGSEVSLSEFNSVMIISEYLKMLFNMVTNYVPCSDYKDKADEDEVSKQKMSLKYSSLIPILVRVITEIPFKNSAPVSPPHSHAIHVLLNMTISSLEPLWFQQDSQEPYILVLTLIEMLKSILNNCFSEESQSLSDLLASLDTFFPPLLILMNNIAKENLHACSLMKECLLPDNMLDSLRYIYLIFYISNSFFCSDRSKPLGKGRRFSDSLISLLTTGVLSHTKDTAGEFLFILCDQDSSKFVDRVGYGNAIGFLTNRGIPFPYPTSYSHGEDDSCPQKYAVNPVTGQY
ncbi:hypothetical protein K7432_016364, partial [Basidiobolus ranarum]